jgi:hypothetical protein
VPDALETYTGGIFWDKTGDLDIVHDISVVGFGVENGTKYWVVRNSLVTHWGEQEFFRLIRGINNIAIEEAVLVDLLILHIPEGVLIKVGIILVFGAISLIS